MNDDMGIGKYNSIRNEKLQHGERISLNSTDVINCNECPTTVQCTSSENNRESEI